MTTSFMYAAGAQYWEWTLAPVDEDGVPIDPQATPVEFAALDPRVTVPPVWSDVVTAAEASATGGWQGPDPSGELWTARVLVSGPGGGGALELDPGTYRIVAQITSVPERPVENTGTLVML